MKNTLAFLLLVLVLPLRGFLAPALTLQCMYGFKTSRQKIEYVSIPTVRKTEDDQINATIYVKPQKDMPMKVVLEIKEFDSASNISAELSLEKNCFSPDAEWWELFMKVEFMETRPNEPGKYKLQVRTSTCNEQCIREPYIQGLNSLNVLISGLSNWTLECLEDCRKIPKWNRTKKNDFPQCNYIAPSTPSTIDSANTITTPATSTTSATFTTTSSTPTTTSATPLPIVIGASTTGGALAGVIVVVLLAVIRRRRRGAATDSPREDSVSILYEPGARQEPVYENVDSQGSVSILHEPAARQEPVYENVDRQGSVNSPYEPGARQEPVYENVDRQGSVNSPYEPGARQEPVYENVDRQGSVNSPYETVSRQGSVNSLYEPFENFRPTR